MLERIIGTHCYRNVWKHLKCEFSFEVHQNFQREVYILYNMYECVVLPKMKTNEKFD